MDDKRIVELYWERSQAAIAHTQEKYGKYCHTIAYNILYSNEDAEECCNDAYLAAWNSMPENRPTYLGGYMAKIIRNISLNRYDRNHAAKRHGVQVVFEELEECLAAPSTVESELAQRELTQAIEFFLDSLSRENRVIFVRRYWFSDPYADIARLLGLTEKNVSVRLTRLRKELRKFLTEREVLR